MVLQSYEAIYDHGKMKWLGEKPQVDQARVIVTILLPGKGDTAYPVLHRPSARIAGKGKITGDILSPASPVDDWHCGG